MSAPSMPKRPLETDLPTTAGELAHYIEKHIESFPDRGDDAKKLQKELVLAQYHVALQLALLREAFDRRW